MHSSVPTCWFDRFVSSATLRSACLHAHGINGIEQDRQDQVTKFQELKRMPSILMALADVAAHKATRRLCLFLPFIVLLLQVFMMSTHLRPFLPVFRTTEDALKSEYSNSTMLAIPSSRGGSSIPSIPHIQRPRKTQSADSNSKTSVNTSTSVGSIIPSISKLRPGETQSTESSPTILVNSSTTVDSSIQSKQNKQRAGKAQIIDLLQRYTSEHSHDALNNEFALIGSNTTREFAIGYYSCPMQAGNRLHHFFNSLVWAIVTNRTLLWKYYDKKVCSRVGARYDPSICRSANKVADCDKILERAPWLPSFDEWAPFLNFTKLDVLSFWSTSDKQPSHKSWHEGDEKFAGVADTTQSRLVEFASMLGQDAAILKSGRKRDYLLATDTAREQARVLLQEGADYLYGLLFHSTFSFHPSVDVRMKPYSARADTNVTSLSRPHDRLSTKESSSVSIVLHSRHSNEGDDGAKVKREKKCLEAILNERDDTFCQVILLADRPATLEQLTSFLNKGFPSCLVKTADHVLENSFRQEHGPFAGVGFYQDLKLVVDHISNMPTSRTAFVGPKHRSSSQLVREMTAYGLDAQTQTSRELDSRLITCYLEDQ